MELHTSNIYLSLYVLFWLMTIILYQRYKRHFDAGSLIICSYLIYSVASIVLYNIQPGTFNNIRLFPFLYLYIMLMLAISPVLKYNYYKIDEIQLPSSILLNSICILFIISTLTLLPDLLPKLIDGIKKILSDNTGGNELYIESISSNYNAGDGSISNISSIFSNAFANVGILLFFYYLTIKKSNKLITIGLLISCIVLLIEYIALGQRGGVITRLYTLVITYFALRKFIKPKYRARIKKFGIILIIAIFIPLYSITNSRFGDNENSFKTSIFYYVGQANLYFNNYALDNGGIRYGDRTFPLFKRVMGFNNTPRNFWERRYKYSNLKINDEVFYTFIGDFTMDYGLFIATIIILSFTFFALKKTGVKNGKIMFHQLILVHFVMCVSMQGGMKLFSFSDVGGNLQIIACIIVYYCFKIDSKMKTI